MPGGVGAVAVADEQSFRSSQRMSPASVVAGEVMVAEEWRCAEVSQEAVVVRAFGQAVLFLPRRMTIKPWSVGREASWV